MLTFCERTLMSVEVALNRSLIRRSYKFRTGGVMQVIAEVIPLNATRQQLFQFKMSTSSKRSPCLTVTSTSRDGADMDTRE